VVQPRLSLVSVVAIACALICTLMAHARDVSPRDLIAAAKGAELSQIDYTLQDCRDTRKVEDWLAGVLGDTAKSVRWAGGRCVLARKERARDAGTKWCAHAVITPKHGKPATIEVYFEQPVQGKPGVPFAFRALVDTNEGSDYVRETWAFEAGWKETHVPGYSSRGFQGCE
jgi:hypothetical protein